MRLRWSRAPTGEASAFRAKTCRKLVVRDWTFEQREEDAEGGRRAVPAYVGYEGAVGPSFGEVPVRHSRFITLCIEKAPEASVIVRGVTLLGDDLRHFAIMSDGGQAALHDGAPYRIRVRFTPRCLREGADPRAGASWCTLRATVNLSTLCDGRECLHNVLLEGRAREVPESLGFELESAAFMWKRGEGMAADEPEPPARSVIEETARWTVACDQYNKGIRYFGKARARGAKPKAFFESTTDLEIKSKAPIVVDEGGRAVLAAAMKEYCEWVEEAVRAGNDFRKAPIRVRTYAGGNCLYLCRIGQESLAEVRKGRARIVSPQATFSVDTTKVFALLRSSLPFREPETPVGLEEPLRRHWKHPEKPLEKRPRAGAAAERRRARERDGDRLERLMHLEEDVGTFRANRTRLLEVFRRMRDGQEGCARTWGRYRRDEVVKGFLTLFGFYATNFVPYEPAGKTSYGLFLRTRWPEYADGVAEHVAETDGRTVDQVKDDLVALARAWWGDCAGTYGTKQSTVCTILEAIVRGDAEEIVPDAVEVNAKSIESVFGEDDGVKRIHFEVRSLNNFEAPRGDGALARRRHDYHGVVEAVLVCRWVFEWLREFNRRQAREARGPVRLRGFAAIAKECEGYWRSAPQREVKEE